MFIDAQRGADPAPLFLWILYNSPVQVILREKINTGKNLNIFFKFLSYLI